MCNRCTELQLAISKGRKLAESKLDTQMGRQAQSFVEALNLELAALQQREDHRGASDRPGPDAPDSAGAP